MQAGEASWKQVGLGLGHRNKSGLEGLNRSEEMSGSARDAHPEDTDTGWLREAASAGSSTLSGSRKPSALAWGLAADCAH